MSKSDHRGAKERTLRRGLAAVPALLVFGPCPVLAATPAGTAITNVASLTFGTDGSHGQVTSNAATIAAAEELGIALSWDGTAPMSVGTGGTVAVPLILTNRGNGQEAFVLTGSVQGLDATVDGFADASGGAAAAPQIANGGHTASLAPGAQLRLVVFVSGRGLGQGTLAVAAHAVTGFGQPGTSFPGQGDNGSDAVVGPTTASATLSRALSVTGTGGAAEPTVTLEKRQTVTAPDGSANPVHGGLILYTLVARDQGPGAAAGAVVSDPIPDGTDLVPGSITLDGAGLADAQATDASGLAVPLGDLAAGQIRTITFQVKIR